MLKYRIALDDDEMDAVPALEEAGVDFDYDSANRMMVDADGLEVLDLAGVDYQLLQSAEDDNTQEFLCLSQIRNAQYYVFEKNQRLR